MALHAALDHREDGAETQAQEAYRIACERWSRFAGTRDILVSELMFVREEEQNRWVDLAEVPLGRQLVTPR